MAAVIAPLLAVIGRPNALDREVSALSVSALLHNAPSALIDPARAAAALHLQQFRTPVWIVMIALQIAVLAWFWNSGLSARLRDRLRAAIGSEFAVRFCFGALVAGLDKLAAFVPQALEYRYMRILDLNTILFRSWLVEWIAATLLAMVVAGCIAAVVLWLADRTHQWYVYTIFGVMGFTLLVSYANPVIIAPAYTRLTPARRIQAGQTVVGCTVPVHFAFGRERIGRGGLRDGAHDEIAAADSVLHRCRVHHRAQTITADHRYRNRGAIGRDDRTRIAGEFDAVSA
jgi:hypothetical protein